MPGNDRRELYRVLTEMVGKLEEGDGAAVQDLDGPFEELYHKVFPDVLDNVEIGALHFDYDNCRQSCVLAFQMPGMYDKCLKDAKRTLSRIPAP